METAFILVLLAALVCVAYLIIRRVKTNRIISNDEMYQRRGIRVEYKSGCIQIKKYIYPVSKVTGVKWITEKSRLRSKYYIKLEVDDIVKPIHTVPVKGAYINIEEFSRSLCLALRKAGGPELIN